MSTQYDQAPQSIVSLLSFLSPGYNKPKMPKCPDCGKAINITKKGKIGKHNEYGYGSGWLATCKASGKDF